MNARYVEFSRWQRFVQAFWRWTAYATVVFLAVGSVKAGWEMREDYDRWNARAPERAVAALPGVGAGWLDTLRRVVGVPIEVDTLTAKMLLSFNHGGRLGGLYESWYSRVNINTNMRTYFDLLEWSTRSPTDFGYRHPAWVWNPAAVTAHEFGHAFQDNVPSRWRGWHHEIFADHFARSMLTIRGWVEADTSDTHLTEVLRRRLTQSYWRDR